jgi:hypothetical protein
MLAHPVMEPLISLTVGDNDIGCENNKKINGSFAIGDVQLAVEQ